jgi:hypothetical protein
MSAESENFEYVWDFQVPGSKPVPRQKNPRTLDSCNLELIPFKPHTFDSIVTLMMNRETSPYIMCACCNDHKFWLREPNLGLEEPKNCHTCPHCDAIICNRCATYHSKFRVKTMNRKCKWCKKVSFLQRIDNFPQQILLMSPTITNIYWLVPVYVILVIGFFYQNEDLTSLR